jgi:hypothetical protein
MNPAAVYYYDRNETIFCPICTCELDYTSLPDAQTSARDQQHRIVVTTALRDPRITELVKTMHIHLDQVGRWGKRRGNLCLINLAVQTPWAEQNAKA